MDNTILSILDRVERIRNYLDSPVMGDYSYPSRFPPDPVELALRHAPGLAGSIEINIRFCKDREDVKKKKRALAYAYALVGACYERENELALKYLNKVEQILRSCRTM